MFALFFASRGMLVRLAAALVEALVWVFPGDGCHGAWLGYVRLLYNGTMISSLMHGSRAGFDWSQAMCRTRWSSNPRELILLAWMWELIAVAR